ncbi:MAG: 1-deoxy-D-xylulose-5-phosphate reductoisomerase [Bacteroidetes bacterium CG12_big_fil_rev_8_21_14_0_65_60_17]|nr:MAG: 1-deoxy-D-xylulose-5-phosphate reductoisomerase [Bacteroidetes bacterium CG12_big_fil_rev_8_21_14_0_65_60_17]
MFPRPRLLPQLIDMPTLAIFGSTGSIGRQALEVLRASPDTYSVRVLSAWTNVELLAAQAKEFMPEVVVVGTPEAARRYRSCRDDLREHVLVGEEGLEEAAAWPGVDTILSAVVGAAGLRLTLRAVTLGRRIALANKESLVVAGDLVMEAAKTSGAEIIPVDSEHAAIFQCLVGTSPDDVERLVLTASGGPFLGRTREDLVYVGVDEAMDHPNWSMGAKITVDSATLMNKGLEVIEAHWLFGIDPDHIHVVVHPQSIVHSMVEFVDGSTLAQLGPPDMRLPIQYALDYPVRNRSAWPRMDWTESHQLSFMPPDVQAFPCLALAFDALRAGPSATAVLNAANEVAVAAFLDGRIAFNGIPEVNAKVLGRMGRIQVHALEDRLALDTEARVLTEELIGKEGN